MATCPSRYAEAALCRGGARYSDLSFLRHQHARCFRSDGESSAAPSPQIVSMARRQAAKHAARTGGDGPGRAGGGVASRN